jgi:hypothetical protein
MAFAFRAAVTAGQIFTAGGTSWSFTTSAAINSGDLIIVRISSDNLDTTDGETSVVSSVSVGGQALTKRREYTNGQGAAAAGVTCSVWSLQNSSALSSGATVAIEFSGSLAANGAITRVLAFTMDNATTLTEAAYNVLAQDAAQPGSLAVSGLASASYLFIRSCAMEGNAAPLTVSSGWSNSPNTNSSSVSIASEHLIATATGATSDGFTMSASLDNASVLLALSEGGGGGGDVFFEGLHRIEQGMKPSTAAGMGGVLQE